MEERNSGEREGAYFAVLLASKMRALDEKGQEALVKAFADTDVIARDIHDWKQADVLVAHSLELTD